MPDNIEEDSMECEEIVFGSEKCVNLINDSLKYPTFLVNKKTTTDALDMLELDNSKQMCKFPVSPLD